RKLALFCLFDFRARKCLRRRGLSGSGILPGALGGYGLRGERSVRKWDWVGFVFFMTGGRECERSSAVELLISRSCEPLPPTTRVESDWFRYRNLFSRQLESRVQTPGRQISGATIQAHDKGRGVWPGRSSTLCYSLS